MGKIPVILLLVVAIWIGWTVYREGPDRAFGGLFALTGSSQYGEEARPTRSEQFADGVDE